LLKKTIIKVLKKYQLINYLKLFLDKKISVHTITSHDNSVMAT